MTEDQVIALIRKRVEVLGSMRALAMRWGVTPSYICDLLNHRRAPGPKVLKPLGLVVVKSVSYQLRR